MVATHKPLPTLARPETKLFWEACRRGELTIQQCGDCGTYIWYPQSVCHACNSWNLHWEKMSGRGYVFSWVVVRHPLHPYFADKLPLTVAMVELEETPSVRMITNIVKCDPADVHIGMSVEVVFQDIDEKLAMPFFHPRG